MLVVYPETTGEWTVDHLPGQVSAIWDEAIGGNRVATRRAETTPDAL